MSKQAAYQKKYNRSEKGKATRARYLCSVKGKAMRKRVTAKYRQSGKARTIEIRAKRKYNHSEKGQAYYKAWNQSPTGRASKAKYRQSPEGKAAQIRANFKRRGALKGARNTLTAVQWESIKRKHGYACFYCGKKNVPLTIDHIIPISAGGEHTPQNVVPACTTCNSSKGDKLIVFNKQRLGQLPIPSIIRRDS